MDRVASGNISNEINLQSLRSLYLGEKLKFVVIVNIPISFYQLSISQRTKQYRRKNSHALMRVLESVFLGKYE